MKYFYLDTLKISDEISNTVDVINDIVVRATENLLVRMKNIVVSYYSLS